MANSNNSNDSMLSEDNAKTTTPSNANANDNDSHPKWGLKSSSSPCCSSSSRRSQAEELSDEVWMQILTFVAPLELLQSVTRVSKTLHVLLRERSYWMFSVRSMLLLSTTSTTTSSDDDDDDLRMEKETKDPKDCFDKLTVHQLQRICLFVAATKFNEHDNSKTLRNVNNTKQTSINILPKCLQYGSLLATRGMAELVRHTNFYVNGHPPQQQQQQHRNHNNNNNINNNNPVVVARRVCLATSTEHASELLENVLDEEHYYYQNHSNDDNHHHHPNHNQDDIEEEEEEEGMLGGLVFPMRQQQQQQQRQQQQRQQQQQQRRRQITWWSSRPSPTARESQDTLLFVTQSPLTLLKKISIQPLLDPYTRDRVYDWNRTVIRAYRLDPATKLMSHNNNNNNNNNNNHHHEWANDNKMPVCCSVAVLGSQFQTIRRTALVDSSLEQQALDNVLYGETPIYQAEIPQQQQQQHQHQHQLLQEQHGHHGHAHAHGHAHGHLPNNINHNNNHQNNNNIHNPFPLHLLPRRNRSMTRNDYNNDDNDGDDDDDDSENGWKCHVIPNTVAVVANCVTITLIGKQCRQFQTSGYYACVESVRVQGIPLV